MERLLKRPRPDCHSGGGLPIFGFHVLSKGSRMLCVSWAVGHGDGSWSTLFSSCCAHERHMGDILCEFVERASQSLEAGGRVVCCSSRAADQISEEMMRRRFVCLAERWTKLREKVGTGFAVDVDAGELLDEPPQAQLAGCSALRVAQKCVRSAAPLPACARGLAAHSPVTREICGLRDNGDPFNWICSACGKDL